MNETGTSEFEVMLYDSGPDGKARIRTLFNFMQSAADSHSKSLGTSVHLMSERNMTWVYSRFYTEIIKYPEMYDIVRCVTWRSGIIDGMVNREFIMTTEDDAEILRATSSLALIDRGTRKPVDIPDFISGQLETGRGRALEYKLSPIARPENTEYIYTAKTRYEDIDINGHMNNASYAQIFFESGYSALGQGSELIAMDILFKGEILYDDVIECGSVYADRDKRLLYQSAFNSSRGRVSAAAVTMWR